MQKREGRDICRGPLSLCGIVWLVTCDYDDPFGDVLRLL